MNMSEKFARDSDAYWREEAGEHTTLPAPDVVHSLALRAANMKQAVPVGAALVHPTARRVRAEELRKECLPFDQAEDMAAGIIRQIIPTAREGGFILPFALIQIDDCVDHFAAAWRDGMDPAWRTDLPGRTLSVVEALDRRIALAPRGERAYRYCVGDRAYGGSDFVLVAVWLCVTWK